MPVDDLLGFAHVAADALDLPGNLLMHGLWCEAEKLLAVCFALRRGEPVAGGGRFRWPGAGGEVVGAVEGRLDPHLFPWRRRRRGAENASGLG